MSEFRHEAFVYDGLGEFVARTAAFVRDGVENDEAVLVVVTADKLQALRDELNSYAKQVAFADMAQVGHNPARIIPAWYDFLSRQGPGGVRGVGEPIWAGRSGPELVECQRHESLLNAAFDGGRPWWLLCPYDAGALPTDVLDEAARSHRFVVSGGMHRHSPTYHEVIAWDPSEHPLPPPAAPYAESEFDALSLERVRELVLDEAAIAGLDSARTDDLVLAAQEVATNTLRHADGCGVVRAWRERAHVLCEVADGGYIPDPLVGRRPPELDSESGRGLWIVNQLCDLVQVRSGPTGTVIRLHMAVH